MKKVKEYVYKNLKHFVFGLGNLFLIVYALKLFGYF